MGSLSRRDFLKLAGTVAVGAMVSPFGTAKAQALVADGGRAAGPAQSTGSAAKVYFTKHIDSQHLIRLYQQVNEGIYGKVAIKMHTGEPHGPNILPRDMVKEFQAQVPNSAIVETNTMYKRNRYTTEEHRETLKINGWDFCPVDIMDEFGSVNLPVHGGRHLQSVAMGAHLVNYDSMIVLTHFKGHAMGGYGGALKNIAIGCASGQLGKRQVHGYPAGQMPPGREDWAKMPRRETFMELMADSGKAIVDYFGRHIVFLNVMRRMSVDCDCAGVTAAEPTIPDIGMLASADILAIDKACVDLVWSRPESEKKDLVERIESRCGRHQLTAMQDLNMGNAQYELISID